MKIRFLNRDIEINKYRININNFKHEKMLIGTSIRRKGMTLREFKRVILFIFMPYAWLDKNLG